VIVSLFDSARDNAPKHKTITWGDFAQSFATHNHEIRSKALLPAWSPARYPAGVTRSKDAVIDVAALVLDLDHVTEQDALDLAARVRSRGLAAVLHTTWRHGSDPWRLRLIVRLSAPVPAEDWPEFWARANDLFGGKADPQCTDASRIYYGVHAPPGTEAHHFALIFEGEPLDVRELLGSPGSPSPDPVPPARLEHVSLPRLESFSKALKRKADDYLSELGATLSKALSGEPFAVPGDVDNTLFRLACVIAKRFPDGDPESIASHFAAGLEAIAQVAPAYRMTPDQLAAKIKRQQDRLRREARAAELAEHEKHAARIREAFGNGRAEPYTPEEIESFGPNITKRWIIQRGRTFYLFRAGSYVGPYSDADVLNAAIRDLAPAASAGVDLFHVDQRGNVSRRSINALVERFGTVAESVRLDLQAQSTTYHEATRAIVEAPCPRREIDPVFHPAIARWLEIMAGEKLPDLLTWLAALTRLDRPCVVLFLTGPPGTGKTLLPMGGSRIWTREQPTTLEDLLGPFNSAVAQCPLVLGDEQLPKDFRGFSKTAELRQAVQATVRPYREKYRPTATLHGAIRIVITANNEEILSTPENLAANDIAAIIDRYFHIATNPEAAAYLRDTDTSGWVQGDQIAEHVLWLAEHHAWEPHGRFLIEVQDADLHRSLTTRSGARGAVCQWLCSYLLNPSPFDNDARSSRLVRVHRGRLLANTQGLVTCWGLYVQNEACPTVGRLSSALASLGTGQRPRLRSEPGKPRINYHEIDTDNLVAWADHSGYAERDQIEEALSRDTEERAPHLAPN